MAKDLAPRNRMAINIALESSVRLTGDVGFWPPVNAIT
jgi:hypothetical protein